MPPTDLLPLFVAAGQDDVATIRQFASEGADLNCMRNGNFLLRNACQAGSLRSLEALLACGADPNRRFDFESRVDGRKELGVFALMYVVSAEAVRILVRHGADVDAPSSNGMTALMGAAFWGDEEIVQALLQCGADPTLKRHGPHYEGFTAHDLALDRLRYLDKLKVPARDARRVECRRVLSALKQAGTR